MPEKRKSRQDASEAPKKKRLLKGSDLLPEEPLVASVGSSQSGSPVGVSNQNNNGNSGRSGDSSPFARPPVCNYANDKPKLAQSNISKYFQSGSAGSNSAITGSMPPTASSAGPASSVIAPKKFSRSTKTLVKSVPKPIEEKPKKSSVVEVIEFDDDDDFIVDDGLLAATAPSENTQSQKTVVASQSSIIDPANAVIELDDNEPVSLPVPLKKPKTPEKSPFKVNNSPVKKTPVKTESAIVDEKKPIDDITVVDSAELDPQEKSKSGFRQFVSRGGPVAPGSKSLPVGKPNCLLGMSFVFTGELDSTSREDAVDLVKRYGGRVVTAPSSKTSYVVVGREPGESKLKKVEQLKIPTVDEDAFFELIEKLPARNEPVLPASTLKKQHIGLDKPAKQHSVTSTTSTTATGTVASKVDSGEDKNGLWTVKYAPKDFNDIIGNKSNIESLSKWLNCFSEMIRNSNMAASSGKKVSATAAGSYRAALLSGPPGIGKTTAAALVARKCGYNVVELNASDARNKASLESVVKELTECHSIDEYFKPKAALDSLEKKVESPQRKKHCIIMDEVDGMGGGDRGGMAELILLIKKTKVPIICICNDRMSTKVRSLANYCLDLRFSRPTAAMIRNRLMGICRREGINIEENALEQLVSSTQSDIRQILNILQMYKLGSSAMNFDQSKELAQSTKKNIDLGPFDLAGKLLSGSAFRGMTMEDKLQIYFSDYQLMPPFLQENYVRMKPWVKPGLPPPEQSCYQLDQLSKSAESSSSGDLGESMIFGRQEFSLMPVHAMFSCVMPATFMQGNMGERLAFPSILGQTSKINKCARLLTEIHMHMNLHVSSEKFEIRKSYMPVLVPKLTLPLIRNGAEAIESTIALMDQYYITKDDWDAMLELSLGPWSQEVVMKKIPTNVKTAFTRTYNKTNHMHPFSIQTVKATKGSGKIGVDLEEAIQDEGEADDDEEVEEDADDKMIKAKPKPVSKGSTSSVKGKGGRGGSSTSTSKRGAKKK